MFKNILLLLIIAIISGCGTPKPPQKPTWFTTPPTDINLLYGVGEADTQIKAKNLAILSIRENIKQKLDNKFSNQQTKLQSSKSQLLEILKFNQQTSKTIALKNLKIEKTAEFKGKKLVLVSVNRKMLSDSIDETSINQVKRDYIGVQNKVAIQKYIVIKKILKSSAKFASDSQFKNYLDSKYDASKNFSFINKLQSEFIQLKSQISFYVLSDVNSRLFTKDLIQAISKEGLTVTKKPLSDNSLRLLVTSKTTNEQEYDFMRSKNLLKLTTYNLKKEKLFFKQHTFVGKSTKNYNEAKLQAVKYAKIKNQKTGIFSFLGVQEN